MADVFSWHALRPDGTGPSGVCLKRTHAIAALGKALHEVEPGVEGVVHAADIEMNGRDAVYRYHQDAVARAYRDEHTGAIVWTEAPDPEPADAAERLS